MNDGTSRVEQQFLSLIMAQSPAQRLAMAGDMLATAKSLIRSGILAEHGLLDPDELRKHLFLRLYGQDFGETERAKIFNSWKTA